MTVANIHDIQSCIPILCKNVEQGFPLIFPGEVLHRPLLFTYYLLVINKYIIRSH